MGSDVNSFTVVGLFWFECVLGIIIDVCGSAFQVVGFGIGSGGH